MKVKVCVRYYQILDDVEKIVPNRNHLDFYYKDGLMSLYSPDIDVIEVLKEGDEDGLDK